MFVLDAWTVDEGLPQSSVTDLAQGPDGFLWVTTFGGLARFDGRRFVVTDTSSAASLPSDRLTAVATGPDGTAIVGTQYGQVARLRGGDAAALDVPADAGVVWDLLDEGDTVWAATDGGLLRVDGGGVARFDEAGAVHGVARAGDAVWAAGKEGLLRVRDGVATTVALPTSGSVRAIAPEGEAVWALTETALVYADGEAVATRAIAGPEGARLLVDPAGRLWMGARDELLLLGDTGDVRRATGEVEPAARWTLGARVRSMVADDQGDLWVGTDGAGLVRVQPEPFERFDAGLPERSVRVVEAGGPEVVVGAGCDGPRALRGGRFEAIAGAEGVGCVGALLRDAAGALWVGHDDLLRRIGGPDLAFPGRVLALAEDATGTLWVGTEKGAFRVRDGVATPVPEVGDGVVADVVVGPDGAVWLAHDTGVVVLAGGEKREIGLSAPVRAILPERTGGAWIGSYGGGLAWWKDGRVSRITRAEGLPENVASVLIDDGAGNLWANGNRGVWRVARADLKAVARGERATIEARRLATGEGNGGASPAASVGPDGRIWFATLDGVVAVQPDDVAGTTWTPTPRVEAVEVDGRAFPAGADERWSAPPGNRDLVVRFTAADLAHPESTRFQVRLAPLEQDWRDVGTERAVRYPSLPPGRYDFAVRARADDGPWSVVTDHASVGLGAHLTETRTFRFGATAAGLFALVGGAALRIRSVQRRNAELRRVEAVLRASEAHYRGVFEAASDGLLVLGPDDVVLDANPGACAVLGRTAEALRGRSWGELVVRVGDRDYGVRADGTRVPVRVARSPFGEGRRLASVTDLSPLVALELLAIGRRKPQDRAPVDVAGLVIRAQPILRPLVRGDVVLELRLSPAGTWARVDAGQLELALVNLVLDAVQALPRGGRITVAVAPVPASEARARWPDLPADTDRVVLSVEDDGVGIPPEHLPRVSAGHVYAESRQGHGTAFHVVLPAAPPPDEPAPPPDELPPAWRRDGRVRVVVCDDEPAVARALEGILVAGGYRVRVADDGAAALALLREEPADVLVSDARGDGGDLAKAARALQPTLKVVSGPFDGTSLLATLARLAP